MKLEEKGQGQTGKKKVKNGRGNKRKKEDMEKGIK